MQEIHGIHNVIFTASYAYNHFGLYQALPSALRASFRLELLGLKKGFSPIEQTRSPARFSS